jgi:hypothetical protein
VAFFATDFVVVVFFPGAGFFATAGVSAAGWVAAFLAGAAFFGATAFSTDAAAFSGGADFLVAGVLVTGAVFFSVAIQFSLINFKKHFTRMKVHEAIHGVGFFAPSSMNLGAQAGACAIFG